MTAAMGFEVVEGWGGLPSGMAYGLTHGVVVDARDNVYVHNRSRDAVIVFDQAGQCLGSWGEEFAAGAHGLFLSREGSQEYLYLADPVRHLVAKATLDGHVLWRLGVPDLPEVYPKPELYCPTDVAVAPGGDFYVCDGYGQSFIHHYSPDGERLASFGGVGSESGRLRCPHGIWVDTRGSAPALLVADRGNARIQVFSLQGESMACHAAGLRQPCCFYQVGDALYVPDLHGRVSVLDRDNRPVVQIGDDPGVWERPGWPNFPPQAQEPGRFIAPHACCVDAAGDLYVVEWVRGGRLTKCARHNGHGGAGVAVPVTLPA